MNLSPYIKAKCQVEHTGEKIVNHFSHDHGLVAET